MGSYYVAPSSLELSDLPVSEQWWYYSQVLPCPATMLIEILKTYNGPYPRVESHIYFSG